MRRILGSDNVGEVIGSDIESLPGTKFICDSGSTGRCHGEIYMLLRERSRVWSERASEETVLNIPKITLESNM
jgi:hypothetical protein